MLTVIGQETNYQKMSWHADQVERLQARIEEMERVALAVGTAQQWGRMEYSDSTPLSDTYMADVVLRNNHEYRRAVSARNGHQQQIQMYSALIVAGHLKTDHIRVDGRMRIRNRISPAVESA